MGVSLRERFIKHSTGPTEEKVSSIASILSPSLTAANHVLTTTVKDNMEDLTAPPPPPAYSPPPPPSELPRKPEKSLCSPSPSLLHRYKGRASTETSVTASASSKKLAKTSPAPANVITRSRSKVPSFTENFGYSKSAIELTTPPRVASTTSINSTTRTVGGVEFEMLNPLQPQEQQIRSRSAEPACARSAEKHAEDGETHQFHRKRESRSETRKVRADSANGDLDVDATKPQQDTVKQASLKATKPLPKSILKKKGNSNPPPTAKLRIPRMTRSTTAIADSTKNTNTNTTTKTVKLIDSSSDSSSCDSSDCEFILDNETGTAPNSTQKTEPKIKPIKVIPPAYISGRLPGLVWMSPLSGTSRPDYPWSWCKRWTCCRCLATTIVEQEVCARLTCGHHRCGDQCMLEKVRRSQLMRV